MSNLFGGDSGAGFSAGGENDPFNFGGAQSAAPDDPFSAIAVSQPGKFIIFLLTLIFVY